MDRKGKRDMEKEKGRERGKKQTRRRRGIYIYRVQGEELGDREEKRGEDLEGIKEVRKTKGTDGAREREI